MNVNSYTHQQGLTMPGTHKIDDSGCDIGDAEALDEWVKEASKELLGVRGYRRHWLAGDWAHASKNAAAQQTRKSQS